MILANATRRILTAVSHVHASALLRILHGAEKAEMRAAESKEQAEEFSRWANEQKQIARQALVEAVERTDITAQAVAAELDTLPALTPEARAVARGW